MDASVKVRQRKLDGSYAPAVEQRQATLVFWLKIVQGDAGEVGDDDVTWNFIGATFACEVPDVAERLRLSLAEVFAETLVLDKHDAGPEQIDVAVLARDLPYRLFKARHDTTADAEHIEEFIPESLLFRSFTRDASPFI